MRTKTKWIGCLAACVVMAAAYMAAAIEERIAFIDLDRVFNDYYKTQLADTQLKDQAEEFNAERKELVGKLKELREAFNEAREEAQNPALSEDALSGKRDAAEEQLIDLRAQEGRIRRFDESRRKQLEDQGKRMRKRIVEEIRTTINKFAQDRGYTAVVDSSGQSFNGVELVLYTDAQSDITDDVLDILNKAKKDEEE